MQTIILTCDRCRHETYRTQAEFAVATGEYLRTITLRYMANGKEIINRHEVCTLCFNRITNWLSNEEF